MGRIQAERSLGDVSLLIRGDEPGSVSAVVHDGVVGVLPGNWMPAGSVMTRTAEGFFFDHPRTGERLEIYVDQIYSEQTLDEPMQTKLTKLGAEREYNDRLAERLHLIEDGLTLVDREYRTSAGPVDLLVLDRDDRPLIVESKRARADTATVYQLRRYRDHLPADPRWRGTVPRGVIVAPTLAKPAAALVATDPDLSFVRVRYDDLLGPLMPAPLPQEPLIGAPA